MTTPKCNKPVSGEMETPMRIEKIGRATLYLGDCREIIPSLKGVSHIITDPPYGEGTHKNHDANSKRRSDRADAQELGYAALTEADVSDIADILQATEAGWIVWFTNFDLSHHVKDCLSRNRRTTFPALPYYHSGRSVRLAGDGPCSWTDFIIVSRPPELKKWGTLPGGYVAGKGWSDKARMGGKPTHLMALIVNDYSREGELILDPFMGAGTTGVACLKNGRDFIGIEIDEKAFDISCQRMEDAYRQDSMFG